MKTLRCLLTAFGTAVVLAGLASSGASAQDPYYYGTYNQSGPGSSNPPPPAPQAVIYQPAPVYRPVYQAPPWALPSSAALGPWPWNFEFGGGPVVAAGSNSPLNGGANFQIGGGYNFSPREGFVLEFMDSGLGVTDTALQANGATNAHADVWGITLNPIWRFRISGPVGGYLIGGGGYYQRDIWYDQPATVFVPTFNGGFNATGTQRVYQDDGTGGVNVGAGLTWNVGWGAKFFVEARYHYILTSGSTTQIIPITIGFRW